MAVKSQHIAIIGGGIVGLATAERLMRRHPGLRITLIEKEPALALHQTGRNSGVLHTGIYYKPGSLKARNCRHGKLLMEQFCRDEGVAFELCGKVIVAVDESELPALERIHQRGLANGVSCRRISAGELREIEPHASGVAALHVPDAGIVDYPGVCERLAGRIRRDAGAILTSTRVVGISERGNRVVLHTTSGDVEAHQAINCAGLFSDRIAKLAGADPAARIVPFRGEYFELTPEAHHLCRNLIYPVPDPKFPFLGVHFTRMVVGGVECGPNAVLALAREGYFWRDVNIRDLLDSLTYPGFWKLAANHWEAGAGEVLRSISKTAFVTALQRLVPDIQEHHLHPAPAGVRAQALAPDGSMVDDFLIVEHAKMLHVLNAPSPAATSSLSIGESIVDRLTPRLS